MKRFIPYGKQNITDDDLNAVIKVLKSPLITQGPKIEEFEREFSKRVNSKFSIAVNSATSALHIACLGLGLKKDDYLWTSPNSFVASANCGLYCGAKIDFIDIDSQTGLISISNLEKKLEDASINNKLPKIVIPVHLCGTSCDMRKIYKLSLRYGFKIIEDASHAVGSKYQNDFVGSCKYSSITVFSFHPVKIITTGEGGIATTNDKVLAEKLIKLRTHGITKDKDKFVNIPEGDWNYEMQDLGFNYRLTDFQAALGLSQLKRLDEIVEERNYLRNQYLELISDLPLYPLTIPSNVYSSVHLFVIRFNDKNKYFYKKVFDSLRINGIGVQLHYSPIHLQPFYQNIGFKKGDFPEAEIYAHNAISLPLYPGLTRQDIEFVYRNLKDVL